MPRKTLASCALVISLALPSAVLLVPSAVADGTGATVTTSDTSTVTIALAGAAKATPKATPNNNQGNGNAPANGTVGNADGKNPPGQSPGDKNNGFKCDNNKGIGNNGGNPAHSGCVSASPSVSAKPSVTPSSSVSPSSSASPTKSAKPSDSPKPSKSATASATATATATSTATATKAPKPTPTRTKVIPRSSASPVIVCAVRAECYPPTPQECSDERECLPVTGIDAIDIAFAGVLLLLVGLLINLALQVQKYREKDREYKRLTHSD